jgi:lauroyl/myristoyl acyltransferase
MVTAHEPIRPCGVHARVRTRHGFNVIYSDRSLFAGLPIVQALRRDEIVGMQIEPWGPAGSHEVEFCGRPTRFQLGPFAVARVRAAPIVAVFARAHRASALRAQVAGAAIRARRPRASRRSTRRCAPTSGSSASTRSSG